MIIIVIIIYLYNMIYIIWLLQYTCLRHVYTLQSSYYKNNGDDEPYDDVVLFQLHTL